MGDTDRNDVPRALLVTPPVYDFAYFDLYHRPYGLLRVGRWLSEHGFSVSHVNALDPYDPRSALRHGQPKRRSDGTGKTFRSPQPWPAGDVPIPRRFARYGIDTDSFADRLRTEMHGNRRSRPVDVVLIGSGLTYWYPGVREAVETVRRIDAGIPIVAGGIYPSLMPEHCERACGVDFVVAGPAWPSLPNWLQKRALPAPGAPPADSVLVDDPCWRDAGIVRISEGCPYRCAYCASHVLTPAIGAGTPDAAFERLCELSDAHGVSHFAFYDDALLHDATDVFDRFAARVIESGRSFTFHLPNAVHFRYVDASRARLMRECGFSEIRFGFESADDEFHQSHGVKFARDDVGSAIDALKTAGFDRSHIILYVLAAMPGQTVAEVEHSIRAAAAHDVTVSVAAYSPVPRTGLWETCVRTSEFPIAEEPLFHNNTIVPMRSDAFQLEDLERLRRLTRQVVEKGE